MHSYEQQDWHLSHSNYTQQWHFLLPSSSSCGNSWSACTNSAIRESKQFLCGSSLLLYTWLYFQGLSTCSHDECPLLTDKPSHSLMDASSGYKSSYVTKFPWPNGSVSDLAKVSYNCKCLEFHQTNVEHRISPITCFMIQKYRCSSQGLTFFRVQQWQFSQASLSMFFLFHQQNRQLVIQLHLHYTRQKRHKVRFSRWLHIRRNDNSKRCWSSF